MKQPLILKQHLVMALSLGLSFFSRQH